MHWAVPAKTLRPLVPAPLELDLYDGVAYVGVVPFIMQDVRPRRWPASLAFNFLETNVRTYVMHNDRPGVYFFSLDAASRLAVWAARRFWKLPYFHAEMSVVQEQDETLYQVKRRDTDVRHRVRYRLGELLDPLQPSSLEFFLLERYLLFVQRGHEIHVGQVHHAPYPAQHAEILDVEDELIKATGIDGCERAPLLAHYAAGVDVEVFGLSPATGN